MKINRLDHIVLTVKSIERTCKFYQQVLGMEVGEKDIKVGEQLIKLHELGKEWEPKAMKVTPGSGDICFITDVPIPEVVKHLSACKVKIIRGPIKVVGAKGEIESVYIRDPDNNLVEISNYHQD